MKDYNYGLFFNNEEERMIAVSILSQSKLSFEHNSCYMAAIKGDLVDKLEDRDIEVNEENMAKCLSIIQRYNIWSQFENCIEECIDKMISN